MAQTDELVNRVERVAIHLTSSSSFFDGRKLLCDDNNLVLYDVNGETSGSKRAGVVLRLAYKNPSTHIRRYIGTDGTRTYKMECDTSTVSRVTYTITNS